MSLSYLKRRPLPALTSWSITERRGEFEPFTREPDERYAARSTPPISSACTSTNHQTLNTSHHERLESEGRHGKKADWVTTQTPSKLMSKISLNQSRAGGTRNVRKRNEPDHGRLVQGIKNALATCVPMVGFSRNLLIEYSYHFSPYGM